MTTKIIRPVEIVEPVFARASTATYVDAQGLVQTAAANVQRPMIVGGELRGVLIEPAATNLFTYSEALADASWAQGATLANFFTPAASPITDIKGTFTARRFTCANPQALFLRKNVSSIAAGTTLTVSMWVYVPAQAGITSWLFQTDLDDLDTGSAVLSTAFGKWVRATSSVSASAARTVVDMNLLVNGGGNPPVGFVLHVCCLQLEVGGVSSYIPTTNATATRAADVLTNTGRDLVLTNAVETVPEWVQATSYTVGTKVLRKAVGRIFMNKLAGVDATLPELAPALWEDVAPSNRMAMFDKEVGSVTSAPSAITVVLRPGAVTALAAQEMTNANQVQVVVKDSPGGTVIDTRTIDLEFAQVLDAYDWFFLPYEARTDAQLTDLPEFPDCEMTVTISGSGTVGCGLLALGQSVELGSAEYGATLGILNRSIVTTNAYGRTTITKRGYHRTMDLKVWVPANARNRFYRFLAEIKDIPCVWIGDDGDGNEALIVYGIYDDVSIVLQHFGQDLYNLRIKGMTL